jgi:hypothetical protein
VRNWLALIAAAGLNPHEWIEAAAPFAASDLRKAGRRYRDSQFFSARIERRGYSKGYRAQRLALGPVRAAEDRFLTPPLPPVRQTLADRQRFAATRAHDV